MLVFSLTLTGCKRLSPMYWQPDTWCSYRSLFVWRVFINMDITPNIIGKILPQVTRCTSN